MSNLGLSTTLRMAGIVAACIAHRLPQGSLSWNLALLGLLLCLAAHEQLWKSICIEQDKSLSQSRIFYESSWSALVFGASVWWFRDIAGL